MFALRRVITATIKNARSKHSLPELPYGYECLEPIISRDIMMLHHQKHHNTYVANLNAAEEKMQCALEKCDVSGMIATQAALRFNGGGHINHSIFWQNLSPDCSKPSELLCGALEKSFGGLDNMKAALTVAAVGVQGSGWGWLAFCPNSKTLRIASMPNQDPLQAMTGLVPLLGIDVWEHAYYLQYKNVRADYVKAIFDVVNWKDVSERYEKAMCS